MCADQRVLIAMTLFGVWQCPQNITMDGNGIYTVWTRPSLFAGSYLAVMQIFWDAPRMNSLLYNGYRVFLGGKERPGRDADPSPPSIAMIKKG